MKIYEILDEYRGASVGTLLYYEKEKTFIVELQSGLDEWTAPLLFTKYVKQGQLTIPREASYLWVAQRVVPATRQNIGAILSNHNLKEYDEMKLLALAEGRCAQDDLSIRKLSSLPDYVIARQRKNLTDCVCLDDGEVLCFFANDTVKKTDLRRLAGMDGGEDIDKILRNRQLFLSGQVGTGGYYMTFDNAIDLPASILYETGKRIPLRMRDFISFARHNTMDTTESCRELDCSRQNLSYMIRNRQLVPVKEAVKGNLFLKGDVLRAKW